MNDTRKATLLGAFVGDALALGAHWVYNTAVIDKKLPDIDCYSDPIASYHSGKKAGDFTHYGDQMMVLLESLAAMKGYDGEHFATQWRALFQDYGGYFDKATKTTLLQMQASKDWLNSGSSSDDLAGASRIAPLVYAYHANPDLLMQSARAQTRTTHNNPLIMDCAVFFAQVTLSVLNGTPPRASLEKIKDSGSFEPGFADLIQQGIDSSHQETRGTISAFGQMCSAQAALPGSVHLICAYENDLKKALVENVRAGGDSSARGMLVGMVLGAHCGMDAIPAGWLSEMKACQHIEQLMQTLNSA